MRWSLRRRPPAIEVPEVARLTAPRGSGELVGTGVGPEGNLAAVWASVEKRRRGETSPRAPAGEDAGLLPRRLDGRAVLLATYDSGRTLTHSAVVAQGLRLSLPLVQPRDGNGYLVVGARCEWRPDGVEQNALVVDADGQQVRHGCLGDGIEHLQRAADGTVWVGYSDEGVFGNFGWNGPGPQPLGAAGLLQWSEHFVALWEHDQELSSVYDCYALNVSTQSRVLACSYDDFAIAVIDSGVERRFSTHAVQGPRGILVAGDRLALIGGYDNPGLVVHGLLSEGRFVEKGRAELRIRGRPLPPDAKLHCRGAALHLVVDREWHRFDFASMDALS